MFIFIVFVEIVIFTVATILIIGYLNNQERTAATRSNIKQRNPQKTEKFKGFSPLPVILARKFPYFSQIETYLIPLNYVRFVLTGGEVEEGAVSYADNARAGVGHRKS